jgi:hypothetical protein
VAAHVAAAETVARASSFDAIVISGDFATRPPTRVRAGARDPVAFPGIAPTLVVPATTTRPGGMRRLAMEMPHACTRGIAYISADLEPTLRLPGVSVVGLNSAAGMLMQAVTGIRATGA